MVDNALGMLFSFAWPCFSLALAKPALLMFGPHPMRTFEGEKTQTFIIFFSYCAAAGGPKTEEAICAAGGVPALLSLIRSCEEEPEQATLLEPATVALSNLAAGSDAHKGAIVEADALPVLVELLTHQVRSTSACPSMLATCTILVMPGVI